MLEQPKTGLISRFYPQVENRLKKEEGESRNYHLKSIKKVNDVTIHSNNIYLHFQKIVIIPAAAIKKCILIYI